MAYVLLDEKPKGKYMLLDEVAGDAQPQQDLDATAGMSTSDKFWAGVGQGMTSIARGIGQLRNEGYDSQDEFNETLAKHAGRDSHHKAKRYFVSTKEDEANARKLDAPLLKTTAGKVGGFVGQVAPTMLIPGVNSYAGASVIGGGLGLTQPIVDGESRGANAAFGVAGGVAGQKLGNVASSAISKKVVKNAVMKAQNATRDATIKLAKRSGFKLPRSLYNPTFMSNRLESVGGKAATLQQASAKNQEVVNQLTRKALDIPESAPLSVGTLEKIRQQAYKPYQEIASLNKGAKNTLEQLKQARSDANAWFISYARSKNPEHLTKAEDFQQVADVAEDVLGDYATKAGKANLINQLKQSRKMIAKTYTAEQAMNRATGDIDARALAREFEKGKPLSDGLDEIGRFASAFPKAAQPAKQSAGAGVSALEAVLATSVGAGGVYGSDSPYGAGYGLLPLLLRPASRGAALSKLMQQAPSYGGGLLNTANKISPLLPHVGSRAGGLFGVNVESDEL